MGVEAGQVVAGRFTLRRPLGEGGMGFVWEASERDQRQGSERRVALKFLKGGKADDRRRFLREMRAAAAVRHPSVVAIHEVLEMDAGDHPLVMVMELLEGQTLGSVLVRDGKIPLAALAATLLPVVAALGAAHDAGIVHRDLKPDNIFLTRAGVKVLDFGVAKLTASEGLAAKTEALTGTGSMIGTPYYMAPEQVESEKDLDARADIWSLGVVMYECLSGVRPTEADTVGRVLKRILMADFTTIEDRCPGLPPDVASLVGRMLVGDRDKRLRDLAEVSAVLAAHAQGAIAVSVSASVIPHAASSPSPSPSPSPSVDALGPTVTLPAAADTHTPVAVTGGRPRPRATIAALGATALVALGVGVWRTPGKSAAPAEAPRAPAPPASIAADTHSAASASASAPASVAAPTPEVVVASASAVVSAVVVPPAAPSATTRCPAGEVASRGHCCARGLDWQGTHCDRPLATTF